MLLLCGAVLLAHPAHSVPGSPSRGWYLKASITVLYASLRCFMPTRLVVHCCRIRFFSKIMASISVVA